MRRSDIPEPVAKVRPCLWPRRERMVPAWPLLVAGLAALLLLQWLWPTPRLAVITYGLAFTDSAYLADSTDSADSTALGKQRRAVTGADRLALGLPLNLNDATSDELMLLPRIGPARSAAIIDERIQGGPFNSVADVQRVHGIGPKTVARLRRLVTVQ